MTVEEVVAYRVGSISAVAALVSTRVYLHLLPQRPILPAVRIALAGEQPGYHQRGQTNLTRTRVQVDSYAERVSGEDPYQKASELSAAIAGNFQPGSTPPEGLSGWRGTDGGSPPSLEILGAFIVDRAAMFEPDEFRLVRVRTDYIVMWRYL